VGIRDRSKKVLIFCVSCWKDLCRSDIINPETREVLTT
jgi:hypothetical protein